MLSVGITIVGKCRLPGQPRQKAGAGATGLAGPGGAMCQEPCALFPAAAGGSSFEGAKTPQTAASASTEASSRAAGQKARGALPASPFERKGLRSEEHTSELQSHSDLVCRLLLEKKKRKNIDVHNKTS